MTFAKMIPVEAAAACCSPLTEVPMSVSQAEDLARSLKAIADPSRLRIISIVASAPGNEACACDLTGPIGLSQPTVSHHLKILTDAGFLTREKRGSWAYYRLMPGALDSLSRLLVTT